MSFDNPSQLDDMRTILELFKINPYEAPIKQAMQVWKMINDYNPVERPIADEYFEEAKKWSLDSLEEYINQQLISSYKKREEAYLSRMDTGGESE